MANIDEKRINDRSARVAPPEPVEGEVKAKIDHAALTRRIIARFPKILAALAK